MFLLLITLPALRSDVANQKKKNHGMASKYNELFDPAHLFSYMLCCRCFFQMSSSSAVVV